MVEKRYIFTTELLAAGDTTDAVGRGSSVSGYALEPIAWLREIVDAAKEQQQFVQFAYQATVPQGNADVIIPYRSNYLGSGDWQSSVTPGTAVNFTRLDNLDGKKLTPSDENYAVAVTYDLMRKSAVDYVRAAREELTYWVGQKVDSALATALAQATAATSSAAGAQTIYGGDATKDSELAAGDTITTDMVAEGIRKLKSKNCYYWTLGTGESLSSASKNPWQNTAAEPFVLAISPEQEEVFLTDSQFTNAAEYGSRDVIANGEIGQYLGVKIVVSNNTPKYTTSDDSPDGESGGNPGVNMTRCLLFKARKAPVIAWGLKPRLHVVDYPSELETRLIIEQAYAVDELFADAIVFIDVADQ